MKAKVVNQFASDSFMIEVVNILREEEFDNTSVKNPFHLIFVMGNIMFIHIV
jgi:hypothetical protein